MNHSLLITHYVMWGMLLVAAALTLRAHRGVSLLAIYCISFAVQVGTMYAGAGDVDFVSLSDQALERLGYGLILAYGILIFFLVVSYYLRPHRSGGEAEARLVSIPLGWMVVGIILALAIVVLRLTAATSQAVLEHGLGTLGGRGYYDLRIDLVEIQVTSTRRFLLYFETTARQILLLMLIMTGWDLARKREPVKIFFFLIVFVALVLNAALWLQKWPILCISVATAIPFLVSVSESRHINLAKTAVRLGSSLAGLLVAGAVLYSVTEGDRLSDSVAKVLGRAFLVPVNVTCMYYEVYPAMKPHVHWADVRPMRVLLDNEPLMPQEGMISIDVAKTLTGIPANFNTSFVGEGWAEAGYYGVALGALLVGLFCTATDFFTARISRGISLLPLAVFYWLGFTDFGNVSFIVCVVEVGLWVIPFFYCFVLARARRRTGAQPVLPAVEEQLDSRPL